MNSFFRRHLWRCALLLGAFVTAAVAAPTVSIFQPTNNASVAPATTVTIAATASPSSSTSTITQVSFFANGVLIGSPVTSTPYSVSWTTPSTLGSVSVTAQATDTTGASTASNAITVNVTSTPTAAITSPTNGTNLPTGASATLTATATTNGGATVNRVDFLAGTTVIGTALLPSTGSSTNGTYTVNWTPTATGVTPLTAKVTDSNGSTATSAIVNVNVTGPTISLTAPTTGATGSVGTPVTLSATPSVVSPDTVSKVDFFAGSTLVGTATAAPYSISWTPASAGTFAITAKVTDSNGATATSAATSITISAATGASITFIAPAPGAVVSVNTPVAITAQPIPSAGATVAQVQFSVNGAVIDTVTTAPYTTTWTPTSAGNFNLTARVVDSASNSATTPNLPVTVVTTPVDPTLPSLAVTLSPSTATTLPQGAVRNISATATATSGRAIERVQFFVDGSKVADLTSPPYNYRFVAGTTTGTSTVTVRAIDNAGSSRDVSTTFTIVNAVGTAPTVTLAAPVANSIVTPGTAVNLLALAQDADGTVSSVQFYARGEPQGSADTSVPYSVSFTPTTPGTYALDAIATDDRGNTAVSAPVSITVAYATPTIAITSPSIGATARATPNVPLSVSATALGGGGAGIILVELLVDGTTVATRTSPNTSGGSVYSFQWTPTTAQLGAHVITTRVTDANSQTATSNPLNVNVANVVGTPPTVTITSPTGSAATSIQSSSMVNFIANAFASGSGNAISSVEFFLNDVSVGTASREQSTNLYRLVYNFANFDLSALTPDPNTGRYAATLYAIAKDSNGNQTISNPVTLGITPSTSLPPTVSLAAFGATTVTQGTAVFLVATPTDPDGTVTTLQLFANGAVVSTVSNPGNPALVTYTPNTAGRFNLYAVVTDDTGNTAISTPPVVLTVTAITAPSTTITRPTDDSTVATVGSPVFLEATAAGSDPTQVPTVSFIATGTTGARSSITATRVGTTTTYRAVWTPGTADTYSVVSQATVSGVSGNSAASRRVVVTQLIGIAPVVTINTPSNGATVTTASTVNFTATATDSDGSVTSVEFFLNRNSIGQAVRDQLTNTWRLPYSMTGLLPGAYELVALVRDSAGNVAASSTFTLNVSAATGQAPSVTVKPSATIVPISQQVQLTATLIDPDNTGGSVQYFANGSSLGASTNATTSYQVNWTPNTSGTFNLYAIATDSNGNTAVSTVVPVKVKANAPVVDDDAFILQSYIDVANNTSPNLLLVQSYSAQLAAGTLTRAQLINTLTAETGFNAPVNLLAAYYVLMGQWPTPTNYTNLLPTARTSLANAIGSILSSPEYIAKYSEHVTPTVTLLNTPTSVIPAQTFANRIFQNAGLGTPGALQLVQFMNNDTASPTLGRGYNVAGLNTALAEFITNTNSANTALLNRARVAALYYQLDKPPSTMSTDDIAARIGTLAALPNLTAAADAIVKDTLYTYRFVTILTSPRSLTVAPKSGALFSVSAIGAPPLSYQWLFNGSPIAGATSDLLSLTNVDASKAGTYTVTVTSTAGSATSDPATLTLSSTPTRLANISTRGVTGGGNQVLIAGFVVTGTSTQTRQVLIRVVGPTLAAANVTGALADPKLEVYNSTSSTPVLTNDNWGTQTGGAAAVTALQQATNRVGAFALPNGSADAAVLATLAPGSYTVQAKGANGTTSGVVLIEVYDAAAAATGPKAINVSTRGEVGTGNGVLIAGFVVNGAVSRRVLIRGVGPTLRNFGLAANAVLPDPQITLTDQASGTVLKTNDDWSTGEDASIIGAAATSAGAFPLASGSKDAAMLVMLAPGAYTVQLSGVGTTNNTGIGIVEVYDVDP